MRLNDIERKLVDADTGEIIIGYSKEDFIEQKIQSRENKLNGYSKRKKKDSLNILINGNLGTFYFHQYTKLLADIQGDTALAFRFLYLCTYADYMGVLMFGSYRNGKHHDFMKEKDFTEVFGLSVNRNTELKKKLYDFNLISKSEDGRLLINSKYCSRGRQTKNSLKSSVRVFDRGVKDLYSQIKPTDHKKAGLLFALLPHINKTHNVACFNPMEQEIERVLPMTIQNIADVVGYKVSNARRLEKELFSIRVNDEYSILGSRAGNKTYYYINPRIYYAGNSEDVLTVLGNMFKIF